MVLCDIYGTYKLLHIPKADTVQEDNWKMAENPKNSHKNDLQSGKQTLKQNLLANFM